MGQLDYVVRMSPMLHFSILRTRFHIGTQCEAEHLDRIIEPTLCQQIERVNHNLWFLYISQTDLYVEVDHLIFYTCSVIHVLWSHVSNELEQLESFFHVFFPRIIDIFPTNNDKYVTQSCNHLWVGWETESSVLSFWHRDEAYCLSDVIWVSIKTQPIACICMISLHDQYAYGGYCIMPSLILNTHLI